MSPRGRGTSRGHGGGASRGHGGGASRGHGGGASRGRGGGASRGCGQGASRGRGQGASRGCGQGASRGRGQGASRGCGQGASRGRGQGASTGNGRGDKPSGPTKGCGRGNTTGISSKGCGRGVQPGGSSKEELKINLQKTINNVSKLQIEIKLEKTDKQHKDISPKKDTQRSKSVGKLNSSAPPQKQHSQPKCKGSTPSNPQKHFTGFGGKCGGRGGWVRHTGYTRIYPTLHMPTPQTGNFQHMPSPQRENFQHMASPQRENFQHMPYPQRENFQHMPYPQRENFQHMQSPPSYEESMRHTRQESFSQHQKPSPQTNLQADSLVKSLAIFRGQFESADTLGRQLTCEAVEVIKVAKSRKDLFSVLGEGDKAKIELVPQVSLCSDYHNDCCNSTSNCSKLHICKTYATEFCDAGPACQYGHRWDTDHNNNILSKLYLDLIEKKTLHQIIRKLSRDKFKIGICNFYNLEQGCKYDTCRKLHICRSYIEGGGKCSVESCNLSHNINEKQCINLLKSQGVAVNEAPRDILSFVISATGKLPGKEGSQATSTEQKSKDSSAQKKQEREVLVSENSSDDTSEVDLSDDDDEARRTIKEKKIKMQKTCKSIDVVGEVEIPEICIFSIDDKCRNDKEGCKYLHAKSLFHWQFKSDGKWYNFRVFQSKKLENAYCDVSANNVEVPALDKNKLEVFAMKLLDVLGSEPWKADFAKMTLTKEEKTLKLRRVSTQSSVKFNNPKATEFGWFCKDDQEKWIQFGKTDSGGKQQFISSLTNAEIEEQYLSNPSSPMIICHNDDKYKIDFSKMVQLNMLTGEEWEIRRRPVGLASQKSKPAKEDPDSSLLPYWSPMSPQQTHEVVLLPSDSSEFTEVSSRLRLNLPTVTIVSIKRLQNPYLWRLLQNKKAERSLRYNENELNMQKLFHGIKSEDFETICKENFDWRQVTAAKQDFGQGTYFSNSAAVERSHCIPDENGRSHMFLAHVLVGMVAKGESSHTRPPVNPQTGAPFDTTVDDVMAPTVFVKYDKDEYYPEYIIEFF